MTCDAIGTGVAQGDAVEVDTDLIVRDGLPEDAYEMDDVLEFGESFDEGVEGALRVDHAQQNEMEAEVGLNATHVQVEVHPGDGAQELVDLLEKQGKASTIEATVRLKRPVANILMLCEDVWPEYKPESGARARLSASLTLANSTSARGRARTPYECHPQRSSAL